MKKLVLLLFLVLMATSIKARVFEIRSEFNVKQFFGMRKPAIIMEGATWCPGCEITRPHFFKASKVFCGDVVFGYIDVDKFRFKKKVDIPAVPRFVVGMDEQSLRSGDSVIAEPMNVENIIKYITVFTGIEPKCK